MVDYSKWDSLANEIKIEEKKNILKRRMENRAKYEAEQKKIRKT